MSTRTSRILAPFSRVTSSGRRFIPEIDGLRFFAIFTVVLYHLNTHLLRTQGWEGSDEVEASLLYTLIHRGGMGVQVFFAISGFILALPFAKYHLGLGKPISMRSYFWRRLTRLEPPYVLCLLGLFVVAIALGQYSFSEGLPHLGASIVYLHNLIYGTWSSINPVAWSLEVEVQFYILAPLLSIVFAIRQVAVRRAVILLAMLAMVLVTDFAWGTLHDWHLDKSILTSMQYFLVGFLVADAYLTAWQERTPRLTWLADLGGLVAVVCLWFGKHGLAYPNQLLFLLGVWLLFFAALRGRWVRAFFSNPWIATIGGMCYSIYLLHYALLALLMRYSSKLATLGSYEANYVLQVLILLPILLVVSAFYFRFFERPFMYRDWPQRLRSFFVRSEPKS